MNWSEIFELVGKLVTFGGAVIAGFWAWQKWRKRQEHFPRINFDLIVEVIDALPAFTVINIIGKIENKGHVPLKVQDFVCEIRGIGKNDELEFGGPEIRNQLNFSHALPGGSFIPHDWSYSFVHPGVSAEYTFVTKVPSEMAYLLVKGRFAYTDSEEGHHAGKIIKLSGVEAEQGGA